MSHRPERKEKNCLNCGTEVYGKYCHKCGQENVEPKETVWHLITHFVYDISHFDGRFFRTVKVLLWKPGFISLEYLSGKRMLYLAPVSMYVFTSAFFFIFFFSVINPEDTIKSDYKPHSVENAKMVINETIKGLEIGRRIKKDSAATEKIDYKIALYRLDLERLKTDTTHLEQLNIFKERGIQIGTDPDIRTIEQYDSAQRALPAAKRDKWINRTFTRKKLEINNKYGEDSKSLLKAWSNVFFHSFPKMLFVSLPLFALLLKLLYVRRRRFFYIDHAIYSIHLYCAMFVLLFFYICFKKLQYVPYIGWLHWLTTPIVIYMFWYVYRSMRKFYQQRRAKTIFKYLLLMFLSSLIMVFIFAAFLILSIFSI